MSIIDTNPLVFIILIVSFIVTILSIKFWIRAARKVGLVGKDMHKLDKREVPEMGGIGVLCGILIGIFLYVAFRTFIFNDFSNNLEIFALLLTMMIIMFIGFIDDILGWKIGLRRSQKAFLTLVAALPIVVINAGDSSMIFPFFGRVDFGILFPLIIIPLIIGWTSNAFNILAGYNGLEAGLGIINLGALSYVIWRAGLHWLSYIGILAVVCIIAFIFFNWYPAKVFPGNIFTYAIGALIGSIAILGNADKTLFLISIPYGVEFLLKLRGKFRKESFAQVKEDGSLTLKYDKWYGLEHISVSLLNNVGLKVKEYYVVIFLLIIQSIFVLIGVLI